MELYAPELLQTKDLVMIEVSISRFRIQEEDDKPKASSSATKYKSKSLQWEKWRAHLELRTVSLISKAPATKQGDAGETSAVTIWSND